MFGFVMLSMYQQYTVHVGLKSNRFSILMNKEPYYKMKTKVSKWKFIYQPF